MTQTDEIVVSNECQGKNKNKNLNLSYKKNGTFSNVLFYRVKTTKIHK